MKNYMVGYGSLMNMTSLNRTLPDIKYFEPINVLGYKRSWNVINKSSVSFSGISLGVEKDITKKINAIIFEINHKMISDLKERESLYKMEEVDLEKIISLSKSNFIISKNDKIWINTVNNFNKPSQRFPITQQYVDVCLNGCFKIQEEFGITDFAKNFILTTNLWSKYWVNDRIIPRTPHLHEPYAYKIDKLICDLMPNIYKKIKIE